MLKLLFWLLLLANGALFAYRQGYLNTLFPDGRESARMTRQLNADKLKLLPAGAIDSAPAALAEPPSVAAADRAPACVEIGNFEAAEAKRFQARLATLALGDKLVRRTVADTPRHIVFIPSQGSKEGADKKAGELRQLGVKDFYVIQEDTDLHWGISLGIFRSEEAARAHLAALNHKGVRSARLAPYNTSSAKVAFQLSNLDAGMTADIDKIKADFPEQEMRNCKAAPETAMISIKLPTNRQILTGF